MAPWSADAGVATRSPPGDGGGGEGRCGDGGDGGSESRDGVVVAKVVVVVVAKVQVMVSKKVRNVTVLLVTALTDENRFSTVPSFSNKSCLALNPFPATGPFSAWWATPRGGRKREHFDQA